RPVFAETVEVGGDRPGPEVGAGAHLRVSDVGQVGDLGALPDLRVLDLDEGPRLRALSERRTRAQVGVRAHLAAVCDLALDEVGVRYEHLGAEDGVDQRGVRADDACAPDARSAAEGRPRLDHGIGLDLDVRVDPGRVRVGDGDAGEHM